MRIVILGAPGSGKRTQTDLAADKYGLSPVMTGELVKTAVMEKSALGLEIKELQDAGRVVTEDIVLALLRERLLKKELRDGFILDGFPRNLLQALTLDELMVEIDQPLDLVLLIDIETDNLMERLVGRRTCRSCGLLYNIYRNPPVVDDVCDDCGGRLHRRSDDNEETVSNRIHVFDHLISSLITHYEKQGKLVRIDGNGDVDQVFSLICKAIHDGAPSQSRASPQEIQPVLEMDRNGGEPDTGPEKLGQAEMPSTERSVTAAAQTKKKGAKRTVTAKGVKKKTSGKKQVKKKKPIPAKGTRKKVLAASGSNKRVATKNQDQKKSTAKPSLRKKATVKQPAQKSGKSSGSSPRAPVAQIKKGKSLSKPLPVKKGSLRKKGTVAKPKAAGSSSKGVAVKKQAKKVLQKKPVVKKISKKKAAVKKPVSKTKKSSSKKRLSRK